MFRKRVPGVGSGNRKSSAADGSQSDWRHDQTVSSGRTQIRLIFTGGSLLATFDALALGCQERRLFDGTHVADGDGGERQLLLVVDVKLDADRMTEILPRQLDDVVQQHGRHSEHYQQPQRFLEPACCKTNPTAIGQIPSTAIDVL